MDEIRPMNIILIAAMTDKRVIGQHNQLPWQMPADLAHFKQLTLGKTIVMGRKTYQSIGRLLPGRTNIIVTRNIEFNVENALVFYDMSQVLDYAKRESLEELWIIGGADIFKQALPKAYRMELTFIHADVMGDSYFPEWNKNEWQEIAREEHQGDDKNLYNYSFVTLTRR